MPNSIETGIDIYGDSFIAGRQNIEYWDLLDKDILIEDTSAMSSQYFKVIQSPVQFEGGKNAIFLLGDDVFLEKDTEILIEVLDSNGDNIFVEVTEYGIDRLWSNLNNNTILDAKGGKRCLAVWVQEDAAPGIGKLVMAGVAARTPDGALIQNNPDPDVAKYYGQINVRWSKDIVIEPFRPNSSELIFLDYDRTKYNTEQEGSTYQLSASVSEATFSYNYLTSDNLETMDTHIYYSMSAMYSTYHSELEPNGEINPVAGTRIPGWHEYFNTSTNENVIKIGVQTGSGRQQGYQDPGIVHVWGGANFAGSRNISQSLPSVYATLQGGGGGPYANGAGINVQCMDIDSLTFQGIESAYGFSISGYDMWRLLASHSFWAPNESHSVGEGLVHALYNSNTANQGDTYHTDAGATSGNYFSIGTPNFPDGVYDFGPISTANITSSIRSNTGWTDHVEPSYYSAISTLDPDGGGSGNTAGWVENGDDALGNPVGAGVYTIGTEGGDGYVDFGFQYEDGGMGTDAFYMAGVFHEFFGNDMTGRSSAGIWTRFDALRDNTNATTEFEDNEWDTFITSMSGEPPTDTVVDGATYHPRFLDSRYGFKLIKLGQQAFESLGGSGYGSSYGGASGWEFFSPTQKVSYGAFEYNHQGTNTPTNIHLINEASNDGGITPGWNQYGQNPNEHHQKYMLWYKPQYAGQTIPFRATIHPGTGGHNQNQVTIQPKPWSFVFTRSAMVHSDQFTDQYTNAIETDTITFTPGGGMPYFDGEMAYDGKAQGLTIDGKVDLGGGGIGFDDWWPPFPPFPPPPPPPPTGGQSTPKIDLPRFLTMIYYDNPTTASTIKNNFWAGGTIQDYTSPVVHDIDTNLWSANPTSPTYGNIIKTNFFNEWVNQGIKCSMSYAQQPQQFQVNNIVSYLNFRIQNMQPITGDVYKVKVFRRPQAGVKSWEFMDEQIVERIELLISESSNRPISSIGFFDSFETIDNNWYTGSGTYLTHHFPDTDAGGNSAAVSTSLAEYNIEWGGVGGTIYANESNPNGNYPPYPTASISDAIILGSIVCGLGNDLVSQSWDNATADNMQQNGNGLLYLPPGYSSFSAPLNGVNLQPGKARSFYDIKTTTGIKLSSATPYELSFVLNAKQYAAFTTGSDGAPTGHNPPCLHVYMTGSAFPVQEADDPLYEHNFGKYVRTYFIHPDQAAGGEVLSFGKQFANFSTDGPTTSDNKIRFIITGGQWILSEISIKNKNQTGFTPADFGMQIKLGTEQYGEIMDFKLEFYNWYNQKANKDYYLYGLWVQGGNTWTNNPSDVATGNTTIQEVGGGVNTGITIFGGGGPSIPDTGGGPQG